MYVAHLFRFDEDLLAIGRTRREAEDALMKEYVRVFRQMNGEHPSKVRWDGEDSFYSLARSEICTVETDFGGVIRF